MADCENCSMVIKDADKAIHDGQRWFCDYKCLGQWTTANQSVYHIPG